LRELFLESGLDTPNDFDGRIEPNLINWPKPPLDSLAAKSLTNQVATPFLYLEGIPYSTCNFVLSPKAADQPATFNARGMEHATRMLTMRCQQNIKHAFGTWQLLDPYNRLRNEVKNYLEDHRDYLIQSGFELNIEENLVNGFLVYTDFIHLGAHPSTFKAQYDMSGYDGKIIWQVFEKDPLQVEGRKPIAKHVSKKHSNQSLTLTFQPKENKVYALAAKLNPSRKNAQIKINELLVWLKAQVD